MFSNIAHIWLWDKEKLIVEESIDVMDDLYDSEI